MKTENIDEIILSCDDDYDETSAGCCRVAGGGNGYLAFFLSVGYLRGTASFAELKNYYHHATTAVPCCRKAAQESTLPSRRTLFVSPDWGCNSATNSQPAVYSLAKDRRGSLQFALLRGMWPPHPRHARILPTILITFRWAGLKVPRVSMKVPAAVPLKV